MQRKRRPLSQLGPNDVSSATKKKRCDAPKRAGTILHMTLKNFMCHSQLEVDLNTNISILIGRNGSGKSAILTALIVGLGGKANLTNRGTSVKNFIKVGSTSASVAITLYNGGPMAYRPQVYGEKIDIVRTFRAGGGGGYKIKNENGEVISSHAREILNITTSLNIQVDNPVCILNQDVSRNFLSSSNPLHKFTLFMKATRLETMNEEYKKIKLNKQEALSTYKEKKTHLTRLTDEMKALKTKFDNQRSIVDIRERIRQLQKELLWAQVRDAEEVMRKEEEAVQKLEEKHRTIVDDCENRVARIESMKNGIRDLNKEISEVRDTLSVQSRPQVEIRRVVDDLRNKMNEKRRERQLISSTIETKTKDVNVLKKEIKNANENMTRVEQEKMQRLRDLSNMNEKIKGVDDHLQTCRNDLYQITSDFARKEDEKRNLRREISALDQNISKERSTLRALTQESDNTFLLYGEHMPKVKRLIEQSKSKFKHEPRGPLGAYIKLKDKRWARAIESHLTSMMSAFAVDNPQDNRLLVQIFNQVWTSGKKPTIITSKFFDQKHDVSRNLVKAPKDCVSLYNAIDIEDPVVSNCIVDQAGIEGILLIPSNERAMELLSYQQNVPRNCRQGVTIDGDKYYPDPDYKTYGSTYPRAKYLQVDTKEHKTQLEQTIEELFEKKQTLESQFDAICTEMRQQENRKNELEQKIHKLNAAKTQVRRQLEELKATAEQEIASVELLETELAELQTTLQEKGAQMAQVEEGIRNLKTTLKDNEEKLQQLKNANSSLEERIESLESQVREETTRQKELSTSEEFDKRRAKECEQKVNCARGELVVAQSTVTELTKEASSVGERIETNKKCPEVAHEVQQLERAVRKFETSTEDMDVLTLQYNEKREKYEKVNTILSLLNENVMQFNTAVEKRAKHYKLTEDYFKTFIKHSFKKIMEVRQFQGSIEIDMLEKKLELIVIPQQGSQGLTTTSNLSGGERSFSTVAFLYALWQCMEFPFYFLDEFDVYMDKLNRSKVIDILLHHAESHPDLQYVFLTPQDVSFVKKNVSILRLQDPKRNLV